MSDEQRAANPIEEKLQKALRDLSILKSALIKEQNVRKDTENKLREKEIEFRQKIEQVESLEFNNARLTKRVESLMEDLSKKSESKPSFMTNLWHGKKDEVDKLQQGLSIMSEDLQAKIEENEKLHIRMYEYKQEQRTIAEGLESKIKTFTKLSDEQSGQIKELTKKRDVLVKSLEEIESKKIMLEKELNEKIKLFMSQEASFKFDKERLSSKVKELDNLFQTRVPFDEFKDPALNGLNAPRPKKPSTGHKEAMQNVVALGEQCLEKTEELSNSLITKLAFISTYAEAEDQKDYNEYSKKIRDSLSISVVKWKKFVQEMFRILSSFSQFDTKLFRKNIGANIENLKNMNESYSDISKNFPDLISTLDNGEKLLKNLFAEEITLVIDIAFIKERNEQILNEFKELKRVITQLFKDIEQLMSYNGRETCNKSEKKTMLWLSLAENLKKISKSLEGLALLYKEKLLKEDEGFSKKAKFEEEEFGRMNYTFQDKIPVNKFRNINNDLSGLLQSFVAQTQSALFAFAEYLEKEFEDVHQKKRSVYPAHFINPNHYMSVVLTQALNENMKSQPKGIPYQESLENRKALNILQEKEIFYNDQISSLKGALQQAENQLDYGRDDQSNYSDASTAKLYEKNDENSHEISQASKIISFMKQRYEEICRKAGEEPDYANTEFNIDTIEKWTHQDGSSEKKLNTKKSKTEEKADIFNDHDSEYLSENVAKGLQRVSMKFMNNQLKLVPLNQFTQADENDSERTRLMFEKTKEKLLEIALKNKKLEHENEDYTIQYEAMKEALNTEKGLREQGEKSRKELEKSVSKLKSDIESVTANYDAKIQMLSEHIITLSSAKEKR